MGWRTLLLIFKLMLLALATADDRRSCKAKVWASDDGKWMAGGRGQVSCTCTGSTIDVRDLSLHLNGKKLATEIVNNTVRHTEPSATESSQSEYECFVQGYSMSSVTVAVIAVLNVTDLTCRFDVKTELNCSFSRADGVDWHDKTSYQLGVGSGNTGQCTAEEGNANRMHCMLETNSYAYAMLVQNFNLTMISKWANRNHSQSQLFELPINSMYVPKWPASTPIPETVQDNQTCLTWENAQELLQKDLEFAVELRPRMPGIPALNLTLPPGEKTDHRILTFCFPHPPQGSQVFDVRLKCHIRENNTIWSDYFPDFEIVTKATVPARPPQFMRDGFSFDKDNNELTVFWFPLDEIYRNGPNLTYDVSWNGRETRNTHSRFATFKNWDVSQPANITVRSRNKMGASSDSSWLWVPAISDVAKRRATHLRYQHVSGSTTLTWKKPEDNDLLLGYTIYWCNASETLGQFCRDGVRTNNITLNEGEQEAYVFDRLMGLQDVALEPHYSDSVSGGISVRLVAVEQKVFEAFTLRKARIMEGIGALLVLGLVIMSARKLKKMNDIEVVMPYMGEIIPVEPKPESEPSPRLGVPRITNPYYIPNSTIVSIELQPLTTGEQEREPEEEVETEESFTEIVAQTEPESSSYVCMDSGNRIGRPPSPSINRDTNGYVTAPPNVMEAAPRLIPNNDGYINPPPPRLNPSNNNCVTAPPPRLNGYVMAPPPRIIPNNNGYVNPPPPRLIPNNDGYINP